jgi:hypothetical protein
MDFVSGIRLAITEAFRRLLEEKHLCQSVEVSTESIEAVAQAKHSKLLEQPAPGSTDRPAASLKDYLYTGESIMNSPWAPDFEEKPALDAAHPAPAHPQRSQAIPCALPPTAHTYCAVCKDRWPFNPVRSLGRVEHGQTNHSDQWFDLVYQCQSCKTELVRFYVRRQGRKLTLCGRDPFEEVAVPAVLPKDHAGFFGSAMLACQSEQTLAGIFLLQVFIEQFWRSLAPVKALLKAKPKATGDELGRAYAKTLPADFEKRFPSLLDIHDRLSDAIRRADPDEALFNEAAEQIAGHFDARRLYKL